MIRSSQTGGVRRVGTILAGATALVLMVGVTACAHRGAPVLAAGAPRPDVGRPCFDLSGLDAADRTVADTIMLTFGDGEGLYTLAGGLKPLSSGQLLSVRVAPDIDASALERLEQRRRVARALRCGDLEVFVHTFAAKQGSDTRGTLLTTELVVAHRRSVADTIRRHAGFFATIGITPSASAADTLVAVEYSGRGERWRGYGYLYGYPDAAVDFFVQAGLDGDQASRIVPRDFRRIETVTRFPATDGGPPTLSAFVYAVPKGASESDADRTLRETAAPIYRAYVDARARHVRPDGGGAVSLWHTWCQDEASQRSALRH